MSHPVPMLDPEFLRNSQYQDDRQLTKRMELHNRFSTNPQTWFDWLFAQIDFPAQPGVLEIGCGTGAIWVQNRHRLPADLALTITDLSPGMLETTQRALPGIELAALVADAQQLPFEAATFDVVIANHVLHHVPDLTKATGEIRRVLKPDGRFYAGTNGLHHMEELFALIPGSEASTSAVIEHFNLENGASVLETVFSRTERRDFINNLAVTQVQPVIDYLESTQDATMLAPEVLGRIREVVATTITEHGHFPIHKSTGVFIAEGMRDLV